MTTSVEIAGFLRSVSTAIEMGKRMLEVAQRSGNTELYNAIVELNRELVDVKLSSVNQTSQIVDLKQEITQLKGTIRELQEASKEENQLILKNNLYYKQNGEGPFCPKCYNENKSISLLHLRKGFHDKCVVCGWESVQYSAGLSGRTIQVSQNNLKRVEF